MECQYCKKTFSSKGILTTHQKKTKYCLKIQGKEPETVYSCNYCNKEFLHYQVYCNHIVSHENNSELMKSKREIEKIREINRNLESIIEIKENDNKNLMDKNQELKEEIAQYKRTLESALFKAVSTPKTTINNTKNYTMILQNKEPLSREHRDLLDTYLTDEVIISPNTRESYGGALTKFFKDILACPDAARQKFISKIADDITDEDMGGIVTTVNGQRIIKDIGLTKVIAFLITPKLSAEHKKRVLALSMIEFAKTNDLDTLVAFSEKIELFQKASEGELVPLFKSIVSDISTNVC